MKSVTLFIVGFATASLAYYLLSRRPSEWEIAARNRAEKGLKAIAANRVAMPLNATFGPDRSAYIVANPIARATGLDRPRKQEFGFSFNLTSGAN